MVIQDNSRLDEVPHSPRTHSLRDLCCDTHYYYTKVILQETVQYEGENIQGLYVKSSKDPGRPCKASFRATSC